MAPARAINGCKKRKLVNLPMHRDGSSPPRRVHTVHVESKQADQFGELLTHDTSALWGGVHWALGTCCCRAGMHVDFFVPAVFAIRPIRGARVARMAALAASLIMVALVAVIGEKLNSPRLAAEVRTQISTWTGRDAGFEGGLRLSLWPRITVVADGFWIADRAGEANARMLTARHTEFHVAWSSLLPWHEVVVESIDIDGVEMRVEVLDDGRSNWHFDASAAPDRPAGASAPTETGAAASVRFDRIRLSELRLTWVNGDEVPAQTFALRELLLVRAQDRIAVTAEFELRKQRWRIHADTDRLETLTARLRPWTFDVQARGPGANFALRGALPPTGASSPLAVTVSADLADSRALDPWLAGAAGRLPVPASVLAKIERRGDEWRIIGLRGSAAGADFDFKGGLVLGAHERPRLDGALHITTLDFALTPAAPVAPGATPTIATQEAPVFGLAAWPLDGVLDISIDRLALSRAFTLHNARAQVRSSAMRLELTQVSARVDDEAMLDGAVRIDIEARTDPAFTLQLNAHALPLKVLADSLIAPPGLVRSGHADLSATLSGQGRSVATLLASLVGDATVTVPEMPLAGAGNVRRGERLDARLTLAPMTQSSQRGAHVQGKVRLAALALEHEQHAATTPASSSSTRPIDATLTDAAHRSLPRWPAEAALDLTLDRLMLPQLPAFEGLTARVELTPRYLAVARAKARFAAARVNATGRVELSEGVEPVYALTLRAPACRWRAWLRRRASAAHCAVVWCRSMLR